MVEFTDKGDGCWLTCVRCGRDHFVRCEDEPPATIICPYCGYQLFRHELRKENDETDQTHYDR